MITSWRTTAVSILLSLIMVAGFLFPYYGKDQMYYFAPDEIRAAEYIHANAPAGSVLIDGTWDWPLQYRNYEMYNYISLVRYPKAEQDKFIKDPAGFLSKLLKDSRFTGGYVVFTRSQRAEVDTVGVMPPGTLDRVEQVLRRSSQFKVVFDRPDAVVFELSGK